MRWRSERPCACLAGHRERTNIIATGRSRSAEDGRGLGGRSAPNSSGNIRRVLFIPETKRRMSILRPLLDRFLDVGAGGLWSARKIEKISKNFEPFVAFRIHLRLLGVFGPTAPIAVFILPCPPSTLLSPRLFS